MKGVAGHFLEVAAPASAELVRPIGPAHLIGFNLALPCSHVVVVEFHWPKAFQLFS